MSSGPTGEHGSLAAGDVIATRPPPPGSNNNAHAPQPPPDWQHRFWAALTNAPRLALVFGLELAIVFAVAGAFVGLRGTSVYTSKTVMLIDDPYKLATAGDDGQLVKLSALRIKYAALVDTSAMAQPVASALHVPMDTVLSDVTAQVPLESLLMDVTATGPTALKARQLSSAMANEITAYTQHESAAYAIPAKDRFTITAIGPASLAASSGPSRSHAASLAVGMGVIGFIVGFCVTQLFRRRKPTD